MHADSLCLSLSLSLYLTGGKLYRRMQTAASLSARKTAKVWHSEEKSPPPPVWSLPGQGGKKELDILPSALGCLDFAKFSLTAAVHTELTILKTP